MRFAFLSFFCLSILLGTIALPCDAFGQLIISEFRLRGPNGANDEFIEIYNNSSSAHTVSGGGIGYAVVASNGVARCFIPNGTVIPYRGHYLCVNSAGYSLGSYPAGNGTTATGNGTYTADIPDNAGIAIFSTSAAAGFILANRMDAVGSTSEANTLYREGPGYPSVMPFSIDYSFYREECGKGGSNLTLGYCVSAGPKDTNNNALDFIFLDTNGTSAGAGQRVAAPGPQNLSSPPKPDPNVQNILVSRLDSCQRNLAEPNAVRDFVSDPANNATFGSIDLRLKVTNLTGAPITKLRFRINDMSIFPAPSGFADLRARSSSTVVVTTDNAPCGTGSTNVSVVGTTLEQPPSQPNGGGLNSTLSVGTITQGTPLAAGGSEEFRIVLGIQQNGTFKLGLAIESLPGGSNQYHIEGVTLDFSEFPMTTPFDFSGDSRSDLSIFRPSNGQWWYRSSLDGSVVADTFGVASDKIVPGDYAGLGRRADRAFFRPSTGEWFFLFGSSFSSFPFGISTDIPVTGDFDGDGLSDATVYRPSAGQWFIRSSSTGNTTIVPWGNSSDLPVPADYDGDRRTDIAIWRPSVGQWWVRYSGGGTAAFTFGTSTDKTVPGDYTGDGKADIAFWRPSNGFWFIMRSEDFSFFSVPFGVGTDIPAPGDFIGDGRFDRAVFRPSNGTWYIDSSGPAPQTSIIGFGVNGDRPVPNAYVR